MHLHHDHHATKEGLPWQGAREPWAEDCEPREPEEKVTLGLPVCPASALLPPHSPHGPGRTPPLLPTRRAPLPVHAPDGMLRFVRNHTGANSCVSASPGVPRSWCRTHGCLHNHVCSGSKAEPGFLPAGSPGTVGIPSWRSSICRTQDGKTGLDHSLVLTQEALAAALSITTGVLALGPPRTGQGEGAAACGQVHPCTRVSVHMCDMWPSAEPRVCNQPGSCSQPEG